MSTTWREKYFFKWDVKAHRERIKRRKSATLFRHGTPAPDKPIAGRQSVNKKSKLFRQSSRHTAVVSCCHYILDKSSSNKLTFVVTSQTPFDTLLRHVRFQWNVLIRGRSSEYSTLRQSGLQLRLPQQDVIRLEASRRSKAVYYDGDPAHTPYKTG